MVAVPTSVSQENAEQPVAALDSEGDTPVGREDQMLPPRAAGASFRHMVPEEEKAQVDREVAEGHLHRVPAGTVGGADVHLLDITRKKDGIVVSSDKFSQHT